MKQVLIVLFLLCLGGSFSVRAQVPNPADFGFDWIEFDNIVFAKVRVSRTGITRIPYQTLSQVNLFPTGTRVNPQRFRVFYRGKAMNFRVIGEEDGSFDPGDYLEVYTQRNLGDMDELLYDRPESKTNPYIATFSSSSFYFVSFQRDPDRFGERVPLIPLNGGDTLPLVPFHREELVRHFTESVNYGEVNPANLRTLDPSGGALDSRYVEGKGYTSRLYAGPNPAQGQFFLDFAVTDAYADTIFFPELEVSIKGRVNSFHRNAVFVGTPQELLPQPDIVLSRYEQKRLRYVASPETGIPFPDRQGVFRFRTEQSTEPGAYTEYSVSFGRLQFPQTFAGEVPETGKYYTLYPNDSTRRAVVEIPRPPRAARVYDLTDPWNIQEIEYRSTASGSIRFVVDRLRNGRKLWVVSDSAYEVATDATAVKWLDMTQLDPSRVDYIILTHKDLRSPTDPISRYAAYRQSPEGGGFRVLTVEIEQLYNTFTFGEETPLAIRRFADYMLRTGDPKFLFIIGKGLHFTSRYEDQLPGSLQWTRRNLIPPYSFPGTDYEYTAGLDGFPNFVPAIPTGRLPAMTETEVENYLQKVIEYERNPEAQVWRKNILQLSGGINANENRIFRSYMEGFAQVASGNFLGADVRTIAKQTTDFVEFFNISDQINQGVGLVTFFGHASLNITDIDIGRVTDPSLGYNNKGRYPLIMVNGCGSGDVYTTSPSSFGENWMLAKDKGAIAFLAHSHLGFSGILRFHTQTFYEVAFGDTEFINKSLGEVIRETNRQLMARSPNNKLLEASAQQVVLQGDPAIRLVPFDRPDYALSTNNVSIAPYNPILENVASPDSFYIEIDAQNLGIVDKARRNFEVLVRRTFSDGTVVTYPLRTYAYLRRSRVLRFPIITAEENRGRAAGQNRFEIILDPNNQVEELSESNNAAELNYFFGDAPLLAIAPREYSIVNTPASRITFVAQNPNFDGTEQRYLFQLDTNANFTNPTERSLTSREQLIRWEENLPVPVPETVHYWRIRILTNATEDTLWTQSSFVYIPDGPEGWSQSHFPQFFESQVDRITLNKPAYRWDFATYERQLDFYAYLPGRGERPYSITIDGEKVVEGNCGQAANFISMVVLDQFTGEVYRPRPGDECGNSLSATLAFYNTLESRFSQIPEGDWVILQLSTGINPPFVRDFFVQAARLLGADSTTINARVGNAFAMVGRRGGTPEDFFILGPNSEGIVEGSHRIGGRNNTGTIRSTRIGPATRWNTLIHRLKDPKTETRGWQLDLLTENNDGQIRPLLRDIQESEIDLSNIAADQFLRLSIRKFHTETKDPLPPQLDLWRVIYQEVPEGILLYDTLTYKPSTTLEILEGEPIQIGFVFENISGSPFEQPLVVRYEIQNLNTGQTTTLQDTLTTLEGNQSLTFQTNFPSLDFFGENQMLVTVNPQLQPEQRLDNNVLPVRFTVKPDDINPVLDVAFDGKRLMDGDLIAPNPVITVVLKDESRVRIRQDTIGINLTLQKNDCDGCLPERINFSDPRLTWQALPENRFEIVYQPDPLSDGSYRFAVQGQDLSGNLSGFEPYQINFQVINASTITHFYPYPNPFSTRTRFVFTLTGSQIPEDIKIQIMTISGKVVRTIHRDELGPLRIGDNITEFAWDGTDAFGDQLANGVYLYKVSIRDAGFDHRETAGDGLFKHNIGKIYLMK